TLAWAASIVLTLAVGVLVGAGVYRATYEEPHGSMIVPLADLTPEPEAGALPPDAMLNLPAVPVPNIPRIDETPSYLIHPGTTAALLALNTLGYTDQNPPTYEVQIDDLTDPIRATLEDTSVTPDDIVAFVNHPIGFRAVTRLGGTIDLAERIVAAGYPVIAATTMRFEPDDTFEGIRLYADYHVITGYDTEQRALLAYDAYDLRPTSAPALIPYSVFDALWTPSANAFIVIFPINDEARVLQILGDYADPDAAARAAFDQGIAQTSLDGADALAWLKLGNACFALDEFDQAADAYDMALDQGLPLTLLQSQFGPFQVYYAQERYEDVLRLLRGSAPADGVNAEEWQFWYGITEITLGNIEEGRPYLEHAQALNPAYLPATAALSDFNLQAAASATATPASVTPTLEPSNVVRLEGFRHKYQTWNNDGPASLAMAFSHYGIEQNGAALTQEDIRPFLRPNTEDKSVQPNEMVQYVEEQTDLRAIMRIGGDQAVLKRLLTAGFPVIVEQGFAPEEDLWFGHYVLLIGYDDTANAFLTYDSYLGSGELGDGLPQPYDTFDAAWQQFNRVFIVAYPAEEEDRLYAALGDYTDEDYSVQAALDGALRETEANADDAFAWFNLGSSYVALRDYDNAAAAYDRAFQLQLPWQMLWYQFGPYEAYYNAGRYNDMIAMAMSNLGTTTYVEETYYWQGMASAALGRVVQAERSFQQALGLNPNYTQAEDALAALPSDPAATPDATEIATEATP
ncbi:MAG TPA: C39 family peptidase, partial [Aggregatilinea sp.]|uniref:C39 family peptidase n=1 Tax=Aggregatilinea sp. TaxID=2806333 RepID=UPI002C6401B9